MIAINVIPFQFRQMLFNLIGNSLYREKIIFCVITIECFRCYCPELKITQIKLDTKYAILNLKTNGIGFERNAKRYLKFFSVCTEKKNLIETGIGLVPRRINDNHNGFINCKWLLMKELLAYNLLK
jgi:hypothetical protein